MTESHHLNIYILFPLKIISFSHMLCFIFFSAVLQTNVSLAPSGKIYHEAIHSSKSLETKC